MQLYAKQFTGTASYVALSVAKIPFSGNLIADASNGSPLLLTVGASVDVPLAAGQVFPIPGCDISSIQIKGDTLKLNAFGVTNSGWK